MNLHAAERFVPQARIGKAKRRWQDGATWIVPLGSVGGGGPREDGCCRSDVVEAARSSGGKGVSRRYFLAATACSTVPALHVLLHRVQPTLALPFPLEKPEAVIDRLNRSAPPQPKHKVYAKDLFYPDHFLGAWTVRSTLLSVQCPAGYKLFGRPGSFEDVQKVSVVYKQIL